MGWIPNSKGGEQYSYTLTGQNSNHTLPNANGSESVPSCIIVVRQPAYTAYNPDKKKVSLGGWSEVYHSTTVWKVLSCRTQLVRYYAASSAKITLSTTINNKESRIAPPGLSYDLGIDKYNANKYSITDDSDTTHEIRPEMQIEIWMGFLSKFETPGAYINSSNQVNPRKYTKVFMGVIDTVDLKLGRGETSADGISCTITARDYMRYLIDNKFFGGLSMPGYDFSSPAGVDRGAIVKALIEQGSAGGVQSEDVAGRLYFHPSGRPPMKMSTLFSKIAGSSSTTTGTTAAIVNGTVPFALVDQFPVDAIRWFSSIETMPRELYCNVNTGRIAWTVRMLGEPYRVDKNSSMFKSAYGVVVASDYADLYKSIIQTYSQWEEGVAREIAIHILKEFPIIFGDAPFMDVITYMSMIDLESNWNPEAKGSPFWPASDKGYQHQVCGLGQINLRVDGSLKLDRKNQLPSDHILKPTLANLDKLKYHITLSMTLLREKLNLLQTQFPDITDSSLFQDHDAQQAPIYQAYNGSINAVITALKAAKVKGKITTANFIAGLPPSSGVEASYSRYWSGIVNRRSKPQWNKYYLGKIKGRGSSTPADLIGNSNIGVFRGLDDPWILTYKRTIVSSSSKTIKPNVLSAHASWSTLGVLTRFTLINPVIESSGAGVGNLRGTHSLWASEAPAMGMGYNDAIRTTADLTGSGTASLAAGASATKRLKSTQEITPAGYKKKYSVGSSPILNQASLTQPYKFVSKIRFPVRNRYMWDESSDASVTDTAVDLILNAMMHVHSQDIHGLDFVVPLNPDMRPSHVVEVHNMGFFNGDKMRVEGVIHMFAAGGVQNGCTTMGVAVSTQASYDPKLLGQYLKSILELQGGALSLPPTITSAGVDPKGTKYEHIASSFDFRNVNPPTTTDLYDYSTLTGLSVKITFLKQLLVDTYNNITLSSEYRFIPDKNDTTNKFRALILNFLSYVYKYFYTFIFWTEREPTDFSADKNTPTGIYGPALNIDLANAENDIIRSYKEITKYAQTIKTNISNTQFYGSKVSITHLDKIINQNLNTLILEIQNDPKSLEVLKSIYNSVSYIFKAVTEFMDPSTRKTYKILTSPYILDIKNNMNKIRDIAFTDIYKTNVTVTGDSVQFSPTDDNIVKDMIDDTIKAELSTLTGIDPKLKIPDAIPFLAQTSSTDTNIIFANTIDKNIFDQYIIGLQFLEELNILRKTILDKKGKTTNIDKLIENTFSVLNSYEEKITTHYDNLVRITSSPTSSPVARTRPSR